MATSQSDEQQATWDTLMVNEQLYRHLFHHQQPQQQQQQRPPPPTMHHHQHHHQQQQPMMMEHQKELLTRSCASSSIMVTPQLVAPPTPGGGRGGGLPPSSASSSSSSDNGIVPLPPPNNTPPQTPASDSWLMDSTDQLRRCGGLSGDYAGYAAAAAATGATTPTITTTNHCHGLGVIGTPSPTRSRCLFDDHDYQKLRQPPRSTPMIRKNFVQHSPMRPMKRNTMTQRKSSTYTRWTAEEDELLRQAVSLHGPHKWSLIASHVPNRTPMQCSTRWLGALNPNIHKGRWTEHEDTVLKYSFMEFSGIPDGEGGFQPIPWNKIAERIPNRTGIQCQARWTEALDPSVRKGKWSDDEDTLLRAGVDKFGRCWIRIAETVPGRTQRQCRTRWMQIKYKEEKMNGGGANTTSINNNNNNNNTITKKASSSSPSPKPGYHQSQTLAVPPPTSTLPPVPDDAGSSGASCTSTEPDSLDFMVDHHHHHQQQQQQQQQQQTPISGLVATDLFSSTQPQHQQPFDFDFDCPSSVRHQQQHQQQQQEQHDLSTAVAAAAVFAAEQQQQAQSNLDLLSDDTLLSSFFF